MNIHVKIQKKKIMNKVRGVTPGYEKMQADSSHQQLATYNNECIKKSFRKL